MVFLGREIGERVNSRSVAEQIDAEVSASSRAHQRATQILHDNSTSCTRSRSG
jgi:hypothetical protein